MLILALQALMFMTFFIVSCKRQVVIALEERSKKIFMSGNLKRFEMK